MSNAETIEIEKWMTICGATCEIVYPPSAVKCGKPATYLILGEAYKMMVCDDCLARRTNKKEDGT